MVTVGPEGVKAFSRGFFELAAAQKPKPQTVAIVAADAEFSKTSADGAKENATANGFKIIYDQSYPPSTTDFAPVVRAVQAANPDLVFVAAYPPDTVGIVRAAQEVGLKPKMFGGTMIGLLITPIKMQLGPLLDGLVIMESFVPAPTFNFPGVADVLKRYQAKAAGEKIDPFGFAFVPFGYAAGQVLAQAVEGTKGLDHAKLADYIHAHTFHTVVGDIAYAQDGEWAQARTLFTQFQNVAADNLDQFRTGTVQPILWPPEYKTGNIVYPYADAKK
jgi:branched-chain amino acid transport system substrate-binding protein